LETGSWQLVRGHELPDSGLQRQGRYELPGLVEQPRMSSVLEEQGALVGGEVDALTEQLLMCVRIADDTDALPGPDEPGQGDELRMERGIKFDHRRSAIVPEQRGHDLDPHAQGAEGGEADEAGEDDFECDKIFHASSLQFLRARR